MHLGRNSKTMSKESIRKVALGRKNYLFAGRNDAAQRAAIC
jgi:hypothetical protein